MSLDVGAEPATVTALLQKMAMPVNPVAPASTNSALPPPPRPYPTTTTGPGDDDPPAPEPQRKKPKKEKKEKPAVTRQDLDLVLGSRCMSHFFDLHLSRVWTVCKKFHFILGQSVGSCGSRQR